MLKYLIVLLDDTSVSFCHYQNDKTERKLIAYEDLKSAITWTMKENLMVQFVYPNYVLPQEYIQLINTIDHVDIVANDFDADITVIDDFQLLSNSIDSHVVLRTTLTDLYNRIDRLDAFSALTIVFTDVCGWNDISLDKYKQCLSKLSDKVFNKIASGQSSRISIVTDRMQLASMNNCNAGYETITLAPDGKYYVCPAFYFDGENSIGDIASGLKIPNEQLYKLGFAPICRNCDAFNCKRCVWLNKKMTHEVNTPSREQCVMAHLERNTSKELLDKLVNSGIVNNVTPIPEIDYLDPFEKLLK